MKIFLGSRGCGKTVRLLQSAQESMKFGYKPYVIGLTPDHARMLKDKARDMGIDTKGIVFTDMSSYLRKYKKKNLKNKYLFVDESEYMLKALLGLYNSNNIFTTIDATDCIKLTRKDWKKTLGEIV